MKVSMRNYCVEMFRWYLGRPYAQTLAIRREYKYADYERHGEEQAR